MIFRIILALQLFCAGVAYGAFALFQVDGSAVAPGWRTLKIGPGGFVTNVVFASDGTAAVRTDTYGCYVWDTGLEAWRQLILTSSVPEAYYTTLTSNDRVNGCYEIAIAPSNPDRIYAIWPRRLLRSDDRGKTFTLSELAEVAFACANCGAERLDGDRIIVDPVNPDIVYVGTPMQGVRKTTDGGKTWAVVSSIPPAFFSGASGTLLVATNGTTAAGSAVLNFASVSASIAVGAYVINQTTPLSIPQGARVLSKTSTTVTLDANITGSGVGSGDSIRFTTTTEPSLITFGGYVMAYDPSSAVVGGVTQGIYILASGTAVYASTDGGATWAATVSGPTTGKRMQVAANGTVWHVSANADHVSPNTNLWKYTSGKWSRIGYVAANQANPFQVAAPDPANSSRIIGSDEQGNLNITLNAGTSWSNPLNGLVNSPSGAGVRVASDVPWLAWTAEGSMSAAQMKFNPAASNKLYFAQGIGVWWSNPPSSWASFNWNSQSEGIEQLVAINILSAPGVSTPVVTAWDRPIFKVTNYNDYPTTGQPNSRYSIIMGWGIDYASTDPSTICALVDYFGVVDTSGCSSDGGSTWTLFPAPPTLNPSLLTADAAAGTNVLTIGGGVLDPVYTGNTAIYLGFVLTTTAPAAAGTSTLTFASVPSNLPTGSTRGVASGRNQNAKPGTGQGPFISGTTVASKTATTITLSANLTRDVAAGEIFRFVNTTNPVPTNTTVSAFTATTITLSTNLTGSGLLSGETVAMTANIGGTMAVSTPLNMILIPSNNAKFPWYTKDGGATWNNVVLSGTGFNADGSAIAEGGSTGWGLAYFAPVKLVAADRVTANKFYLLNCRTGAGGGGIWVTTDGGDNWTKVFTGQVGGGACQAGGILQAVPGFANELLYSSSVFATGLLYRSTDGGVTWNSVSGVSSVVRWAFGATKPGESYPSIYVIGTVGGVASIFRSDDGMVTWTNIGKYPNDSLDSVNTIQGDMNVWGRVFVGFNGSGWAWGQFNFLLKRDIEPAANDNTPMFLNKAA